MSTEDYDAAHQELESIYAELEADLAGRIARHVAIKAIQPRMDARAHRAICLSLKSLLKDLGRQPLAERVSRLKDRLLALFLRDAPCGGAYR